MYAYVAQTFSVVLNYSEWVGEKNTTGADLLLSYFEDVLSEMPIGNGATACRMDSAPYLMFTFRSKEDANVCLAEIERTWQQSWLANNE